MKSVVQKGLKSIRYMAGVMLGLIGVFAVCFAKAEASAPVFGAAGDGEEQQIEIEVTDDSIIPDGVYINETHVGGMTIGEAKAQLKAKEEEISTSVFTVTQGDHVLEIPFAELGLTFQNTTDVLYHAATVGQTGMLVDRYKELKDLENDRVVCTWSYSFDLGLLEERAAAFAEVIYVEPVDATIDRQNHQWFREPHVNGVEMDVEATLEAVRTAVDAWDGTSVSVEAVVNVIEPKYTEELLDTITEIIGSHVTFMGGEVEEGRGKNVVRGAELIHGTILLPGESFSAHAALSPFTEENGYDNATAYNQDTYVDSIGGGVCQLTTTLYKASLYAELQIDRRYNHSMIVTYEDYGFDSTVNDDASKDLVISNPYDFPIYIEAKAWGETADFGQVYFAIWGTLTEEKKAREIELYNVVLEREDAETIYTVDPELEPGEEVVIQSAYPRIVVEAYKKVTVNGEVISDEYLHTDYYRRSDGKVNHNPIEESTGEETSGEYEEESTGETTEGTTETVPEETTEEAPASEESTGEAPTAEENTTAGEVSGENTTESTEEQSGEYESTESSSDGVEGSGEPAAA